MLIGVLKETFPGERRVAVIPSSIQGLKKTGLDVEVESGAGTLAGFPDQAYADSGAWIKSRSDLLSRADVILQVRGLGANPEGWQADIKSARTTQTWIAIMDALWATDTVRAAAEFGITAFALDLMPRITRAQSMDVLSSQANLAGYKATLLAADALPKLFPMMMTAAGTITPSRVLVIGAGVAGLQAIATAKRLGAVVSGYDVRPAVREQVESLGARFVALEIESAEGEGGYARAMDEEFYRRQAELLGDVIAEMDVVITTASVPGAKAPVLIKREMAERMRPGSVIVDIAADRGGNCEITRPGKTVDHNGVMVMGPLNLPSAVPYHASQLFAKNITTFLAHLVKDGQIHIDEQDEITSSTLLTRNGEVVNAAIRERLGMRTLVPRQVEQPAQEGGPSV